MGLDGIQRSMEGVHRGTGEREHVWRGEDRSEERQEVRGFLKRRGSEEGAIMG